jgi:hypothetical protein
MALKKSKTVRLSSAKSDDQPATRKMLKLVRRELIHRMDSGFNRMEARFSEIDARFSSIDGRFSSIDARFSSIDARFNNLEGSNARMELLFEEQTANNKIVLEGLQAMWQRQDFMEVRLNG